MNRIVCIFFLFLLIFLMNGCAETEEKSGKNDINKVEDVVKPKVEEKQEGDSNQKQESAEQKMKPISLPTDYKWLEDHSKTKKINPDNSPIFAFYEEDLDLNGKKEAVVAFGERTQGGTYPNFFILQPSRGDSTEDAQIFKSSNYSSMTLDIVRLSGSERPYVYTMQPGGNHNGISLYSFDGSRIKPIFEYILAGAADLYDDNGDGYMDGYSRSYGNYTSCGEYLMIDYKWDGESFQEQNMPYDVGPYPTDPKELIHHYAKLLELGSWYPSTDIERRLTMLTGNKKVPTHVASEIRGCSDSIIDSTIKVIKNDGQRMSLLFLKESYTGNIQLIFELQKKGERWIIAEINESTSDLY